MEFPSRRTPFKNCVTGLCLIVTGVFILLIPVTGDLLKNSQLVNSVAIGILLVAYGIFFIVFAIPISKASIISYMVLVFVFAFLMVVGVLIEYPIRTQIEKNNRQKLNPPGKQQKWTPSDRRQRTPRLRKIFQ